METDSNNTSSSTEAFFIVPSYWTGEPDRKILLPNQIALEDGTNLEFSRRKTLGVSTGGFYKDESSKEFMVKNIASLPPSLRRA